MTFDEIEDVRRSLYPHLSDEARTWVDENIASIEADPASIRTVFPAVGRHAGRDDLGGWTIDDGARALFLVALGEAVRHEIADLYHYGDAAERRGILRALHLVPVGEEGMALVRDALRTNDATLVGAALGRYGLGRLLEAELNHALMKCVFMEIPLNTIPGLRDRVTPEFARMAAGFVLERVVAGRAVPIDVWPVIEMYPPVEELEAIKAELHSPIGERRAAAASALAMRDAQRTTTLSTMAPLPGVDGSTNAKQSSDPAAIMEEGGPSEPGDRTDPTEG